SPRGRLHVGPRRRQLRPVHREGQMKRLAISMTLLAGCASEPGAGSEAAAVEARPVRVQSGARLFLLGVTDDDHAIFQAGTHTFATALHAGARREPIAETGPDVGDRNPMVFTSGKVAFVWPDAPFFGIAVSRLYVWTAAGGARLATDASLPTTGAV